MAHGPPAAYNSMDASPPITAWTLLFLTITEVLLLGVVVVFFVRLRQSEALLSKLQSKQDDLLSKLRFNAQLEQELVSTFEQRQKELADLDASMEERSKDLRRILKQAEQYSRSPQFLREAIQAGRRSGKAPAQMAKELGLSTDEIELILHQK